VRVCLQSFEKMVHEQNNIFWAKIQNGFDTFFSEKISLKVIIAFFANFEAKCERNDSKNEKRFS
jgi:hypothetical protein